MKNIALPVEDNMLCEHFGHAQKFKLYSLENQKILNEELIIAPVHQMGLLPRWLAKKNVTDVIVAGIGHKAIEVFNQNKINVFVGVQIKEPLELVNDYLNGTLETNGNLCDH
jgi:predicted Fe-Mo cluster-binding NifX family protein